MVSDYVEGYYVKAHAQFRALERDNSRRVRELTNSLERIRRSWDDVWVGAVEEGPGESIPVGSSMRVRAEVHLGRLDSQDVVVELYSGRVDMDGQLVEGESIAMQPEGQPHDETYDYTVVTSTSRSGLHGFTVRVRPYHPDMPAEFIPGLICWADPSRVPALVAV